MEQLTNADWKNITTEEAYRLSQAEFRGVVTQALQDIRDDIKEIKKDKAMTRYISFGIASGIAGIVSAFGAVLHK